MLEYMLWRWRRVDCRSRARWRLGRLWWAQWKRNGFSARTLAITVVGATVLTVVLGLIGTYSALRAPSAPVLRTE